MKKTLLVVLTLLSISVLSLAAFRDVPKGHWAEGYVQKLEEIGVVTGFPDGTYRGDEAITRYQIALYIVRTLDYVDQLLDEKQVMIDELRNRTDLLEEYTNLIYDTLNTKADSETVEQLYEELYSEIEKLQNDLLTDLEDIKLTLDLHDQDIIQLYDLINNINDKFIYTDEEGNQQEISLVELKDTVDTLNDILNGLAGTVGDIDYTLRMQIDTLRTELTAEDEELAAKISEMSDAIETAQLQIAYVEDSLVNTYSVLSEALMNQQEEFTATTSEISGRIDELETRVLNIEDTIATGLPVIRDMVYGLSEDLKTLEDRTTAYTDIRFDELSEKTDGRLEVLEDRVNLLENQVISLEQVLTDTKADKMDVEDLAAKVDMDIEDLAAKVDMDVENLAAKVDNVEKTAGTKAELEQAKQLATWGVVTGVVGITVGVIAIIGSLQNWF
ncbi:MAG TPA: S-layer homology domain-containing protein [Fervidobacterium sp.]|nr:S-layer homology domain-containing protein [Fervidobacterium sp.]HPT53642.1 S-layer homology domain-containing protein [Fervidobacterium sp.]HPZ18165.1 S-layer homology domain-containing protein [Fervidobacterium sp.]